MFNLFEIYLNQVSENKSLKTYNSCFKKKKSNLRNPPQTNGVKREVDHSSAKNE